MAEFEIKVCSGSSSTETVVGSIGDTRSAKNVDKWESSASPMGQSIQDVEDPDPKIESRLQKLLMGNFRGQVCLAEDKTERNPYFRGDGRSPS